MIISLIQNKSYIIQIYTEYLIISDISGQMIYIILYANKISRKKFFCLAVKYFENLENFSNINEIS